MSTFEVSASHRQIASLLLVLGTGTAVAALATRVRVPYNAALVVVGLALVVLGVLPRGSLDPDLVLSGFLPVLVFEGAWLADAGALRGVARPVVALALPGVAISLLGTAALAWLLLSLPFTIALLLGALLAITDTVSVLLAFRSARVPRALSAIMEGESLFNDGTALVLVGVLTTVAVTGAVSPMAAARDLLLAIAGGLALGAAMGLVGAAVLRAMPDHLTATLASVVLVFATSTVAERVHASPIIAVVLLGLFVGHSARRHLEPSRRLALEGFWETAGFALNVVLFLLVGLRIDGAELVAEAGPIAVATVALHVGRALAVYGSFGVFGRLLGDRMPLRFQHVMVLGNIKGALSMAAVLALPESLPEKPRLVAIVFGATFMTLVTQAIPFRRALAWLGVIVPQSDVTLERAKAVLVAARRTGTDADELLETGLLSRSEHARRRAEAQRRILEAEQIVRRDGNGTQATQLDIALLESAKSAVLDAARRGLVTREAAEEEAERLDHQRVVLTTRKELS